MIQSRPILIVTCSLICFFDFVLASYPAFGQANQSPKGESNEAASDPIWAGAKLEDWEISDFGTQRDVKPIDGGFELSAGYPLTGVYTKALEWPTSEFELAWEFRRVEGRDFPCCVTFPVGESHCSFVVGGWGGTLCGLSCLDGKDAAHNETAKHMEIENGKWYRARIRVTPTHIRCWLDDESIVNQPIEGVQISVRNEVRLSRPLGICSFETTSQIRNFTVSQLNLGADR